jgi:predicted component of viral defense system (DUF524 family)
MEIRVPSVSVKAKNVINPAELFHEKSGTHADRARLKINPTNISQLQLYD